jgi:hypothetical protein
MAEQSSAPDPELLEAAVREMLTLAGLSASHDDQGARRRAGGFSLFPRDTSVRVTWSPRSDVDDVAWDLVVEEDPHHALLAWESRAREAMLRAMGDILWAAGFTVAFTPAVDAEDIMSDLVVLAAPRSQPAR